MVIHLNEQYNGGFLPGILMLTQAPIVVELWSDDIIIVLSFVFVAFGGLVWRLM